MRVSQNQKNDKKEGEEYIRKKRKEKKNMQPMWGFRAGLVISIRERAAKRVVAL